MLHRTCSFICRNKKPDRHPFNAHYLQLSCDLLSSSAHAKKKKKRELAMSNLPCCLTFGVNETNESALVVTGGKRKERGKRKKRGLDNEVQFIANHFSAGSCGRVAEMMRIWNRSTGLRAPKYGQGVMRKNSSCTLKKAKATTQTVLRNDHFV